MAIAIENLTALERLGRLLAAGQNQAVATGRPTLVSYTCSTPSADALDFFAQARNLAGAAFFWERAEDRFALAGSGQALTLQAEGPDRFEQIEQAWLALQAEAIVEDERGLVNDRGTGPVLFGGFAFDVARPSSGRWQGFPDGQLALPQVMLTVNEGAAWLTFNRLVDQACEVEFEAERLVRQAATLARPYSAPPVTASSQPLQLTDVMPASDWQRLVGRAVADIRAGRFQKVVLAREVRVSAGQPFEIDTALRRLRRNYPAATLFAIAQGERCFLGATPERLARLDDGEVRTIGLAGSAPRGQTEAEDRRLGQGLLDSPKNRQEHAIVVQMLREALQGLCGRVWADDQPRLLKLPNVQHLYTPVLGRLAAPVGLLKLVERLHPTPALGGYPRQEALAWLRENERLDRGRYAAPVGWLDRRGEGEFVVGIRSALVEGRQATLYAGCGIVTDSDPASEYAESCLKLKPMLAALVPRPDEATNELQG